MSEDLKRIVASVYSSGARGSLSTIEFVNILSYNLRFFPPDRARKVHQAALGSGLLRPEEGGMFRPSFPLEEAEVPPDYRPNPDMNIESLNRSLSERLIESVCDIGMNRKEAIKAINRTAESLNLLFPAAAIYLCVEEGKDMSMFLTEVESTFLNIAR
ncbi:MAG: DUF2240 family protein [Candidatus Thermoplasmatota archaeon]|nr:DUF2240 family protein [Candidatus Thermoplasmatota archaeon]